MAIKSPVENAEDAYTVVSLHLAFKAKEQKTAKAAIKKHRKELVAKLGSPYDNAVDTLVDAYYNMDNYAPDGKPIDLLYRHIDNII